MLPVSPAGAGYPLGGESGVTVSPVSMGTDPAAGPLTGPTACSTVARRSAREDTQMPLVIGAVAPHRFPIIPDIIVDAEGALRTRDAMLELGRRFAAAQSDVVVISGPHG